MSWLYKFGICFNLDILYSPDNLFSERLCKELRMHISKVEVTAFICSFVFFNLSVLWILHHMESAQQLVFGYTSISNMYLRFCTWLNLSFCLVAFLFKCVRNLGLLVQISDMNLPFFLFSFFFFCLNVFLGFTLVECSSWSLLHMLVYIYICTSADVLSFQELAYLKCIVSKSYDAR